MKVLISTDLEGISGVCVFQQTRERGPLADDARLLLMGDMNAAVEGCLAGGADQVVIVDGHGGGFNIVPALMHPKARYVTGTQRPPVRASAHLYQDVDAAILLGYHAMAGTPDGILCHTQSSRRGDRYWYNGRESGEIAQSALIMGHFSIPVVMVTGDAAACREAREFLGDQIVTVSVKEGISIQFGSLLAPEAAHELIRQGCVEAMKRIPFCAPFALSLPIHGRLEFPDKETADAFGAKRAARVHDLAYEATFPSALEVIEF